MTDALTPEAPTQTKPGLTRRPWFKPALGILLLAVILFWAPVLGLLTASGKVSDEIDRGADQVNIVVKLAVDPDQYHRETLSELGVYSGRDREDATILRLRAVTQSDLDRIARFFWVKSIEPF